MNELIMKEKKDIKKREKRSIRSKRNSIGKQEMQEKIDELVSLLFEEKDSILKERKKK